MLEQGPWTLSSMWPWLDLNWLAGVLTFFVKSSQMYPSVSKNHIWLELGSILEFPNHTTIESQYRTKAYIDSSLILVINCTWIYLVNTSDVQSHYVGVLTSSERFFHLTPKAQKLVDSLELSPRLWGNRFCNFGARILYI